MITTQAYDESSGQQDAAALLARWNWGAFLLNWIWGLGNRCYFGLLTFVPFFGLFVPFVLGWKGNAWAWRSGKWHSFASFQEAQRRWTRSALIVYAVAILMAASVSYVIMGQLKRSAAFALAYAELARSEEVLQLMGSPLETGMVMGSFKANGGGVGEADIAFPVSGPVRKGKAYVHASQHAGVWQVEQLALVLSDGQRLELREHSVSAAEPPRAAPPPAEPPPSVTEPPRLSVMRVHLASEKTEVRGALPRAKAEAALDAQRAQLEPCLERLIGPSKLDLKLLISPRGSVQRASVERARAVDADTRDCIVRVARGFEFPAPKRGLGIVTQTIAIGP